MSNFLRKTGFTALAIFALAGAAQAGECPAGDVMENAVTSGATMPQGVVDEVISTIDLTPKGGSFEGMALRMRRLTIQPGGIVPWHDHATRPANILVVAGEILEHRSSCKTPVVHKQGEVVAEFGAGLAHWWENTGDDVVVLISSDIVTMGGQPDSMM